MDAFVTLIIIIVIVAYILKKISKFKKKKAINKQLDAEYDGFCALYELLGYACLVDTKTMAELGTNYDTELVVIQDVFKEFIDKGYVYSDDMPNIREYFSSKLNEENFDYDYFKKIDGLLEFIKKMNPGDPNGNLAELDNNALNELVLVSLVRVIAADLVFDEDEKRYYDAVAEKLGVSDETKKLILDDAKGGTKAAIRKITLRSLEKIPTVSQKLIDYIDDEFKDLSDISSITADELKDKVPGLTKASANAILSKFVKHKEREKKV